MRPRGCCLWYGVLAWMGEEEGNRQRDVLGVSLRLLLFDHSGLGGTDCRDGCVNGRVVEQQWPREY